MKKHLLTIAAVVFAMTLHANVVFDESFDYTVGEAIASADNWTTTGDITQGDGRIISDVSLSYSDAGGEYVLSGGSKSLKHNYASNKTGSSNGKQYLSYRSFTAVESGAVYLSYIYKPDGKQNQSNGELLGLTSGTSNPSARPWVGKLPAGTIDGSVYRFGLTMRSGTSAEIVWSESSYSATEVVFLVLKYDITNHSASLFINPTIGSTEEPVADLVDNNDAEPRDKIDAIMFRNQGASKSNYYIGGVRVSTTWAEAVAKKEDSTPEVIETIERIVSNFSDTETLGEPSASAYTSGSFPNDSVGYFECTAAGYQAGSINYELTGERFVNRISIDKSNNGGMLTFPAVASCAVVDIYASSGSENRNLTLQKYNYTSHTWNDVQTLAFAVKASCYRFSVAINSTEATKLRLVNADGSTKYIWKVVTYASVPANLSVPSVSAATDVTATGFTANWSAVDGAAAYRVVVYDADNTVVKRLVAPADAVSLVVEELSAETAYTYKVAAVGDDETTVGSALSEAQSVTTSADTETMLDNVENQQQSVKVIRNGEVLILRGENTYNVLGKKL
ncbi:MAG: fibronectin type III domain-containing protein [Paludibacteraceae bacterium]|nr:fibronectin type III domain-containing protein [Paludibacteraceae bacterium]